MKWVSLFVFLSLAVVALSSRSRLQRLSDVNAPTYKVEPAPLPGTFKKVTIVNDDGRYMQAAPDGSSFNRPAKVVSADEYAKFAGAQPQVAPAPAQAGEQAPAPAAQNLLGEVAVKLEAALEALKGLAQTAAPSAPAVAPAAVDVRIDALEKRVTVGEGSLAGLKAVLKKTDGSKDVETAVAAATVVEKSIAPNQSVAVDKIVKKEAEGAAAIAIAQPDAAPAAVPVVPPAPAPVTSESRVKELEKRVEDAEAQMEAFKALLKRDEGAAPVDAAVKEAVKVVKQEGATAVAPEAAKVVAVKAEEAAKQAVETAPIQSAPAAPEAIPSKEDLAKLNAAPKPLTLEERLLALEERWTKAEAVISGLKAVMETTQASPDVTNAAVEAAVAVKEQSVTKASEGTAQQDQKTAEKAATAAVDNLLAAKAAEKQGEAPSADGATTGAAPLSGDGKRLVELEKRVTVVDVEVAALRAVLKLQDSSKVVEETVKAAEKVAEQAIAVGPAPTQLAASMPAIEAKAEKVAAKAEVQAQATDNSKTVFLELSDAPQSNEDRVKAVAARLTLNLADLKAFEALLKPKEGANVVKAAVEAAVAVVNTSQESTVQQAVSTVVKAEQAAAVAVEKAVEAPSAPKAEAHVTKVEAAPTQTPYEQQLAETEKMAAEAEALVAAVKAILKDKEHQPVEQAISAAKDVVKNVGIALTAQTANEVKAVATEAAEAAVVQESNKSPEAVATEAPATPAANAAIEDKAAAKDVTPPTTSADRLGALEKRISTADAEIGALRALIGAKNDKPTVDKAIEAAVKVSAEVPAEQAPATDKAVVKAEEKAAETAIAKAATEAPKETIAEPAAVLAAKAPEPTPKTPEQRMESVVERLSFNEAELAALKALMKKDDGKQKVETAVKAAEEVVKAAEAVPPSPQQAVKIEEKAVEAAIAATVAMPAEPTPAKEKEVVPVVEVAPAPLTLDQQLEAAEKRCTEIEAIIAALKALLKEENPEKVEKAEQAALKVEAVVSVKRTPEVAAAAQQLAEDAAKGAVSDCAPKDAAPAPAENKKDTPLTVDQRISALESRLSAGDAKVAAFRAVLKKEEGAVVVNAALAAASDKAQEAPIVQDKATSKIVEKAEEKAADKAVAEVKVLGAEAAKVEPKLPVAAPEPAPLTAEEKMKALETRIDSNIAEIAAFKAVLKPVVGVAKEEAVVAAAVAVEKEKVAEKKAEEAPAPAAKAPEEAKKVEKEAVAAAVEVAASIPSQPETKAELKATEEKPAPVIELPAAPPTPTLTERATAAEKRWTEAEGEISGIEALLKEQDAAKLAAAEKAADKVEAVVPATQSAAAAEQVKVAVEQAAKSAVESSTGVAQPTEVAKAVTAAVAATSEAVAKPADNPAEASDQKNGIELGQAAAAPVAAAPAAPAPSAILTLEEVSAKIMAKLDVIDARLVAQTTIKKEAEQATADSTATPASVVAAVKQEEKIVEQIVSKPTGDAVVDAAKVEVLVKEKEQTKAVIEEVKKADAAAPAQAAFIQDESAESNELQKLEDVLDEVMSPSEKSRLLAKLREAGEA